MENLTQPHDLAKGQQEMVAVRFRRRYRLCQVLTFIGVLFLLALGSINLTGNMVFLGVLLISNAVVGLINLYVLKRSGNVERAATVLSFYIVAYHWRKRQYGYAVDLPNYGYQPFY